MDTSVNIAAEFGREIQNEWNFFHSISQIFYDDTHTRAVIIILSAPQCTSEKDVVAKHLSFPVQRALKFRIYAELLLLLFCYFIDKLQDTTNKNNQVCGMVRVHFVFAKEPLGLIFSCPGENIFRTLVIFYSSNPPLPFWYIRAAALWQEFGGFYGKFTIENHDGAC